MSSKKGKHKKKLSGKAVTCVALSIVIGVGAGWMTWKYMDQSREVSGTETEQVQTTGDNVIYEGKTYEYNKNLTNILFMGIDKEAQVLTEDIPGTAGQADCIMILSLDQSDKTCRVLQISRDSMTGIDIYDSSGNYYTSIDAQLATQYAYGTGGENSCWAMKKTVKELLYGLPIEGFFSMSIEGIGTFNDALGGVTLTVPEDYTNIDPAFEQGAEITLSGSQAEKYVRSRDTNVEGSNNERMERQVQFVSALFSQLKEMETASQISYESLYQTMEPYLVTDLSVEQIKAMASYTYLSDETEYVPGKVVPGEKNEEFHVDEDALQKLVLKMFYKEIK